MAYRIVVIGSSLGGFRALSTLLHELPREFPLPIVIAQHRSVDDSAQLAELLGRQVAMPVCEVEDKDELRPGYVHVCPSNYHLLLERDHLSLSADPPVLSARPSINVLFESAADSWGASTIGVLLTGMSRDGTDGLKKIKEYGGMAVVQDPSTAEGSIMPAAAISAIQIDKILPLEQIAAFLVETAGIHETRVSGK
jgi:two-component system chemotaxis response regulator CheB